MKKYLLTLVSLSLLCGAVQVAVAQKAVTQPRAQIKKVPVQPQPVTQEVIGIVESIASDGSYLMINGTKVMTNKDFIEDNIIEVDDMLKLVVEKTGEKMTAVSSEFIFDFEDDPALYKDEEGDSDDDDLQYYQGMPRSEVDEENSSQTY